MKKVISLLIVSTFIFGARNIDNLMYINPGMKMEQVHNKIDKPYQIRGTKITNNGKKFSIHEHYLRKNSKLRNQIIKSGIIGGIWGALIGTIANYDVCEEGEFDEYGPCSYPVTNHINWIVSLSSLSIISKSIKTYFSDSDGEKYWFFYEDDILTFFCKPGDWETTAPPTLRVQWQDLTND